MSYCREQSFSPSEMIKLKALVSEPSKTLLTDFDDS